MEIYIKNALLCVPTELEGTEQDPKSHGGEL